MMCSRRVRRRSDERKEGKEGQEEQEEKGRDAVRKRGAGPNRTGEDGPE